MKVLFSESAWEDFNDNHIDKRLKVNLYKAVKEISRVGDSLEGLGKAERLKGNLSGYISRRLDASNRLVYKVENISDYGSILYIAAFVGHY